MASNKKVSQKDLRQMMRERKEIQAKLVTKIESPLAKYDSNGRLSCILCDITIKSDSLWSQHIVGTIHKNKLEEMKRKKLNQKLKEEKAINKPNLKTNLNVESKQEIKPLLKRKLETNEDDQTSNKSVKKSVDIRNEDIDRNTNEINNQKSETNLPSISPNSVSSDVKSVLPNDFFDNPNELIAENNTIDSKEPEIDSNSLPKGFFDDPVLDAKARHVPFKDPIDEEWDKFQKVIAEETNTSQNIIEEEIEEIQVDRTLVEIEEQISNWSKVDEMQKRAEELHKECLKNGDIKVEESESDSDVDDQEMNVFSNWRSRGAINLK